MKNAKTFTPYMTKSVEYQYMQRLALDFF